MIKVAVIGIVTVIIAILCRGIKNEYGIYAGIAGSIIIAYLGVSRLSEIVALLNKFGSYISAYSAYVTILLKMLGIAYIGELASNISKDAGYNTVASQIEIAGKLSILIISIPILEALLDTVFSMMEY